MRSESSSPTRRRARAVTHPVGSQDASPRIAASSSAIPPDMPPPMPNRRREDPSDVAQLAPTGVNAGVTAQLEQGLHTPAAQDQPRAATHPSRRTRRTAQHAEAAAQDAAGAGAARALPADPAGPLPGDVTGMAWHGRGMPAAAAPHDAARDTSTPAADGRGGDTSRDTHTQSPPTPASQHVPPSDQELAAIAIRTAASALSAPTTPTTPTEPTHALQSSSTSHRFVWHHDFIENAFQQRFQGLLRDAGQQRSWHVIIAEPRSGKSTGIADLILHSGQRKEVDGRTRMPLLAVRAPKERKDQRALVAVLVAAFGRVPHMSWDLRSPWLVDMIARVGVECLVVDDAQDLSLAQLAYIKELTDNLEAQPYQRKLGICLVTAAHNNSQPFHETFGRTEVFWQQFRERLDAERPYCTVLSHTVDEVREILAVMEELYHDQLPDLSLIEWASSVSAWLTHPALDPYQTRRVRMGHLISFVRIALKRAHLLGVTNINGELLRQVAELMTLRRNDITQIDGIPAYTIDTGEGVEAELPHVEVG